MIVRRKGNDRNVLLCATGGSEMKYAIKAPMLRGQNIIMKSIDPDRDATGLYQIFSDPEMHV